uniref:Uncharacterized protein n=1 Tax=Chromera velia CCMP2878 TaxID=1169474 RepID=A0A0G4I4I8_9ALVE|eukprot:Cvel_10870.t1-p1 / transcript=Cvel_10870.t1 / gene=Cvel_10870 / organism=Chromera_velia_CCMP2878 / gene_product=Ribosomal small subunit pseudouridine synthase A, putative / transcript_product=Ribosomal small subunit pseudouridine synthase A, putative / location=Cvel_scaffold666:22150-25361(+) / protein_length=651 / sequence_SO=supercontig / SO=protein_coding / is_pseudo=false
MNLQRLLCSPLQRYLASIFALSLFVTSFRLSAAMRLDRYLCGSVSLKATRASLLIRHGFVEVDGNVVTSPSWQVFVGLEDVRVRDRRALELYRTEPEENLETAPSTERLETVAEREGKKEAETETGEGQSHSLLLPVPFHRIYMMNKPAGFICERSRYGLSWLYGKGRIGRAEFESQAETLRKEVAQILQQEREKEKEADREGKDKSMNSSSSSSSSSHRPDEAIAMQIDAGELRLAVNGADGVSTDPFPPGTSPADGQRIPEFNSERPLSPSVEGTRERAVKNQTETGTQDEEGEGEKGKKRKNKAPSEPQQHPPSVYDVLPADVMHADLGIFGRLDRDTTGLLLLGTDGGLQAAVMSPSANHSKTYVASLRDHPKFVLQEEAERKFREGLVLGDGSECAPAELLVLEKGEHGATRIQVTLSEGMYHQVKRMVAKVGGNVCSLHRLAIGSLRLDESLQPGEVRELSLDEMKLLREQLPEGARDAKARLRAEKERRVLSNQDGSAGGGEAAASDSAGVVGRLRPPPEQRKGRRVRHPERAESRKKRREEKTEQKRLRKEEKKRRAALLAGEGPNGNIGERREGSQGAASSSSSSSSASAAAAVSSLPATKNVRREEEEEESSEGEEEGDPGPSSRASDGASHSGAESNESE